MNRWIGITLGDVTGVGPEVVLKALAAEVPAQPDLQFLIFGDHGALERNNKATRLPLEPFRSFATNAPISVLETSVSPLPPDLPTGAPAAARAAVNWLREGTRHCLRGELAALVTAPVNKAAILRTGEPFVGQTELLSRLAGTQRTAMMLLGPDPQDRWLRVLLVTTHLPLRHVADRIAPAQVEQAIELAVQACQELDLPRARVGVCGLNPHAGEGGLLGTEEQIVIRPAIAACRARGLDVVGPVPADIVFYQAWRGEYEVVVAMYHDQGLGPLKLVAFERGINWTVGLPFIRTSPDHGTAYDLVGQNRANPSSMVAALRLARQLAAHRFHWATQQTDPMSPQDS